MRRKRLPFDGRAVAAGEWLIAAGLAVLSMAAVMPLAPVATGLACTALGATRATLARSYRPGRRPYVLAAHLFIYANLYVLLLGAVFHAAATGSAGGLEWPRTLDVICSLLPMAVAIGTALAGLGDAEDSVAR